MGYRPPTWRIAPDPRDTAEPLSRTRLLMGIGCLLCGFTAVYWLISQSPRPEPVFSPMAWDEMARQTTPNAHWVRHWLYKRPHSITFMQLVFILSGIGLGLWFIHWSLSRPRALFFDGLLDRDER